MSYNMIQIEGGRFDGITLRVEFSLSWPAQIQASIPSHVSCINRGIVCSRCDCSMACSAGEHVNLMHIGNGKYKEVSRVVR